MACIATQYYAAILATHTVNVCEPIGKLHGGGGDAIKTTHTHRAIVQWKISTFGYENVHLYLILRFSNLSRMIRKQ